MCVQKILSLLLKSAGVHFPLHLAVCAPPLQTRTARSSHPPPQTALSPPVVAPAGPQTRASAQLETLCDMAGWLTLDTIHFVLCSSRGCEHERYTIHTVAYYVLQ